MASVTVVNRREGGSPSDTREQNAVGIVVLQGGATQHTQGRGVMQLCGLWIQEKGVEEGREREQAFIGTLARSDPQDGHGRGGRLNL